MRSFNGAIICCVAISLAHADTSVPAPDVEFIAGSFVPGVQPDGNSIVINARDGLILVDTGRHPTHLSRVFELADAKRRPIDSVINTHWHLDHIGGNARVRARFPKVSVLASAALQSARAGFLAQYERDLRNALVKQDLAQEQRKAFESELFILQSAGLEPDVVITASGERRVSGRVLDMHLEQGATAGDVWFIDRASGVLVAGDLVTLPAPFFDTACPSRWSDALSRVAASNFDVLIPGHGNPMTRLQFADYRRAFDRLLECATSESSADDCASRWFDDVGSLVDASAQPFARQMLAYYFEQVLRNSARQKELCAS